MASPRKDFGQDICANPECGKKFKKHIYNQEYCSVKCRARQDYLRCREDPAKVEAWKGSCKKWRGKNRVHILDYQQKYAEIKCLRDAIQETEEGIKIMLDRKECFKREVNRLENEIKGVAKIVSTRVV